MPECLPVLGIQALSVIAVEKLRLRPCTLQLASAQAHALMIVVVQCTRHCFCTKCKIVAHTEGWPFTCDFSKMDLERIETNSDDSFATHTTSSAETIWGPGTLSGRAIKSLGEASLRGVETLIIRWRLAKISSNLPQNQKSPSTDKMERMYDDLLELSRLDYYDAKVRMKALRMIMMQIGSRETSRLVSCIAKWPESEISIFLSEMMTCMLIFWQQNSVHAVKSQLDLITVFCSSQSATESHDVIPFIDFISQLGRVNHTSCQAIVDAKFLDVLAEVHRHCSFETTPEVIASCKRALSVLLDGLLLNGFSDTFSLRRMDLVWPRSSDLIPLSEHSLLLAEYTPRARQEALQTFSKSLVWDRLCEIEVIMSAPVYFVDNPGTETDLFDVCIDLLHLSLNHDDPDIARASYDLLIHCIALGDGWWAALRNVLILLPYNANLDFFYRLVYPLLRLKIEVLPPAANFYKYVKASHPDVNPAEHFVQFAIYVAERSSDSALALKNADIISLLSVMRQNNHEIRDYLVRLLALFQQLSDAEQAETVFRQTRDRSASNATLK